VTAVALVSGLVVVWQLGFTSAKRTPIPPVANAAAAAPNVQPAAKPRAKPAARRVVAPKPGTLVVRAVRGPCWVAVRIGGANGRLVYQRIVGTGGVVRFGLNQALWVRLGAPWNADVTLRGKQLPAFPPRQPVNLRAS
jgi:hypothetical protein